MRLRPLEIKVSVNYARLSIISCDWQTLSNYAARGRGTGALRDFNPAYVRFGSFTSFPPSRRVRFSPKSRHSASARVYEYTAWFPGTHADCFRATLHPQHDSRRRAI